MNGRRASKLRTMVAEAIAGKWKQPRARDKAFERLHRAVRERWARMNARERGRFGLRDVRAMGEELRRG